MSARAYAEIPMPSRLEDLEIGGPGVQLAAGVSMHRAQVTGIRW